MMVWTGRLSIDDYAVFFHSTALTFEQLSGDSHPGFDRERMLCLTLHSEGVGAALLGAGRWWLGT
jgi:hypothetical protein